MNRLLNMKSYVNSLDTKKKQEEYIHQFKMLFVLLHVSYNTVKIHQCTH